MTKFRVSIICCILVVLSLLVILASPVAAFDGYGSGTAADPYQIWNYSDLDNVSSDLAAAYQVKTNIDLSRISNWVPIGNISNPFTGMFDGGPFTIMDLTISGGDNAGLFGCVAGNAVLKNIVISGASIQGAGDSVGILAGNVSGSARIDNCSVSGTVNAGTNVGGLIGIAVPSSGSTIAITNCYVPGFDSIRASGINSGGLIGCSNASSGTIIIENCLADIYLDGNGYVGGLVGSAVAQNGQSVSIMKSSALGRIDSSDNWCGGLVGKADVPESYGTILIQNSYADCDVYSYGVSNVGGILGGGTNNTTVEYCYASGNVSGRDYVGGLVGFVSPVTGIFTINNSAALSPQVSGTSFVGRINGTSTNESLTVWTKTYALATMDAGSALDGTDVSEIDAKTQNFYEVTLGWDFTVWRMGLSYPDLPLSGIHVPRHGSAENPYYIFDLHDLEKYRSDLSGHFILAADLNLRTYLSWEPIGTESDPFTGSFEGYSFGCMHDIKSMKITRSSENYAGFFGHVGDGAALKNITMTGVSVKGDYYVGSLAGYIHTTDGAITIQNCSVSSGDVTGNYYVGGLIGDAEFGTGTNILETCSFSGSVSASNDYVGGLIGQYWGSSGSLVLSDSKTDVEISRSGDNAGGFIGGVHVRGSTGRLLIQNCSANGIITSTGSGSGGFIGFVEEYNGDNFTLRGCYASGSLTGNMTSGGLIGKLESYRSSEILLDSCGSGVGITASGDYSGGIIAYAKVIELKRDFTLQNSLQTGNLNCRNSNYAGGLIGYADIETDDSVTVRNNSVSGNVDGNSHAGGLIGYVDIKSGYSVTIIENSVSGNVDGNSYAGGLIGYMDVVSGYEVAIEDCISSGLVSITGDVAGGLIGYANADTERWILKSCGVEGSVISGGMSGGLAGEITVLKYLNCIIDNCYANESVTGSGQNVSGFIGSLSVVGFNKNALCSLQNCSARGSASGNSNTGGLIGAITASMGDVSINNCSVNVNVDGSAGTAGGLAGHAVLNSDVQNVRIYNISSAGNVAGGSSTGGLIGYLDVDGKLLSFDHCCASGNVAGSDDTGGLLGLAVIKNKLESKIVNSSAKGEVSGDQRTGGFAGNIILSGTGDFFIQNIYAVGKVTGSDLTGGLFGSIQAPDTVTITDTYSSGMILGNGKSGGLIGNLAGNPDLKNSAVLSPRVTGSSVFRISDTMAGTNVYALKTMEAHGAYDGIDVDLSHAKKQSFYQSTLGWDFDSIWKLDAGMYKFPVFKWESAIIPSSNPSISVVIEEPEVYYNRLMTIPVNISDAKMIDTFTVSIDTTTPAHVAITFNETKTKLLRDGYYINDAYSSSTKVLSWSDLSSRNNISGENTLFWLDVIVSDGAVSPIPITFTVESLGSKGDSISPSDYPVIPGWLTIMPMEEYVINFNATVPAEKGYRYLSPDKIVDITVPQYSWGARTIYLTEEVVITKWTGGIPVTVPAVINADNTVSVSRDISDADYLMVQFIGRRLGDVNNNGEIDIGDAVRIARGSVSLITLSEEDKFYADINRDGVLSGNDAIKIARYIAYHEEYW